LALSGRLVVGRGHDRAGGRVLQALEDGGRPLGGGRVEAVELDAVGPVVPPVDRLVEPAVQLGGVGAADVRQLEPVRRQVLEREAHPLAGPDVEAGDQVVVVGRSRSTSLETSRPSLPPMAE